MKIGSSGIINMKQFFSTKDSTRRSHSEVKNYWDVSLQGYHIRFQFGDELLKVQVISLIDFKYYFGGYRVDRLNRNAQSIRNDSMVPQKVMERGVTSNYQSFTFKNGQLTLQFCGQFSRFRERYTFPPLKKLQLHGELFEDIDEVKRMQLELKITKMKNDELQLEKRIVMKQLRRVQTEVTQQKRTVELQQEMLESMLKIKEGGRGHKAKGVLRDMKAVKVDAMVTFLLLFALGILLVY